MSTPTAPSPLHTLTDRIERLGALDAPGGEIGKRVRGALSPGAVKDALSGTWLGHAVHPLLTDVVIGSFTSATILDLIGGERGAPGADRLVGIGLAAYAPTALTGVTDWADSELSSAEVRRVGLVHAATNASAFALYALSARARRRGRRGAGRALGLAGAGVLGVGGYLGGHLSYARGVGVDQTSFDAGSGEWTPVLEASQLGERSPKRVLAGETPVLLVRDNGRIMAVHDRCSHRGCSLAEGELGDATITCACHGSRFRLTDGTVERGPATSGQPAFQVRQADGRIDVRLPA